MRIRSFIIAYALVLAILLFAERRPSPTPQDRYSHVVDLTGGRDVTFITHIIAPDSLIPGTWTAGQIPPGRLVAPLVVIDLTCHPERSEGPAVSTFSPNLAPRFAPRFASRFASNDSSRQISLDDIAAWESQHGIIPQGAVVAIRGTEVIQYNNQNRKMNAAPADSATADRPGTPFPITREAAMFLIDARYTIGFALETPANLSSDHTLAHQLALHGSYVVEGTKRFTALPPTGSLIIVAPTVATMKDKKPGEANVRILAMVR
jgi:kynurenine formamidase